MKPGATAFTFTEFEHPVLIVTVEKGLRMDVAGTVDERVNLSLRLEHTTHGGLHGLRVGNITGDGAGTQFAREGGQFRRRRAAVENDRGPMGADNAGRRRSNTAR